MPVLVSDLEVGKSFVGKFGLRRKIIEITDTEVKFLVTALGSKPPAKFQLMQEYTVKLEQFANWAVE